MKVDITPDKSLIKKLGLAGYRTEQAISELIDNAIDAKVPGRIQRIDVSLGFNEKTITITDSGLGMNMSELKNALTIAKETKSDAHILGRFGIGMKSACSNLGRRFRISTRKENSDTEFYVEYDEEVWLADKTLDWKNFEIHKVKKTEPRNGTTTITISKLNVPLYPNQVTSFKETFGIRYGPYLESGQVDLRINSRECKAMEPDIEEGTRREISISLPGSDRLVGWIGLLKKRSIKGDYGIHLYRKRRLIKAFAKFGIRAHPEIAKVIGEIHLDHVPVNFHKTGFLTETLEYRESVNAFKNDPVVIEILQNQLSRKVKAGEISRILESTYARPDVPIDTRMSTANAKTMLKKAEAFSVKGRLGKITMEFHDRESDLYSIYEKSGSYIITINRSSVVFQVFKNPLFLIGMIKVEAELIMESPLKYKDLLRERNNAWNKFVEDWSPRKDRAEQVRDKRQEASYANYSLSEELIELHDHLKERFAQPFQFTGLSTLSPFLHNAYSTIVYSIQTAKGSGSELQDMIREHCKDRFTVLLEPDPREMDVVVGLPNLKKIIVIREYAEKPTLTWAGPEKSWLDLYVQVEKKRLGLYRDEIPVILDELAGRNLVSETKLRSAAIHRHILNSVEPYLKEVF